ncbi:unnamed protein product [Protopolystoma xenopodis]|uniref:Uncharacterized protein n=1 Tax=Protopolystoma xenopodis TaxID=117903 RepID=A0A3S5CP52_9PLAT|nr:unnamed protein product [Protopolystoma xenopodis]
MDIHRVRLQFILWRAALPVYLRWKELSGIDSSSQTTINIKNGSVIPSLPDPPLLPLNSVAASPAAPAASLCPTSEPGRPNSESINSTVTDSSSHLKASAPVSISIKAQSPELEITAVHHVSRSLNLLSNSRPPSVHAVPNSNRAPLPPTTNLACVNLLLDASAPSNVSTSTAIEKTQALTRPNIRVASGPVKHPSAYETTHNGSIGGFINKSSSPPPLISRSSQPSSLNVVPPRDHSSAPAPIVTGVSLSPNMASASLHKPSKGYSALSGRLTDKSSVSQSHKEGNGTHVENSALNRDSYQSQIRYQVSQHRSISAKPPCQSLTDLQPRPAHQQPSANPVTHMRHSEPLSACLSKLWHAYFR